MLNSIKQQVQTKGILSSLGDKSSLWFTKDVMASSARHFLGKQVHVIQCSSIVKLCQSQMGLTHIICCDALDLSRTP